MLIKPWQNKDLTENKKNDSIKNKKTIIHLTALDNLENIFLRGLQPRANIQPKVDVADHEIIEKRKKDKLEKYVPFHFFMKNPFDGAVIRAYPNTVFVYLSMLRSTAKQHNFLILPNHPLSDMDTVKPLPYDEGFKKINWALMDKRDYNDQECKLVCMAECLSPRLVPLSLIHSIVVQNEKAKECIEALQEKYPNTYTGYIDIHPEWFPKYD